MLCLSLSVWTGWDKWGKFVSTSVKTKETGTLFLQISLHEYVLPELDKKYMLFVSAIKLMINLASLILLTSKRWRESLKTKKVPDRPLVEFSRYFDL